MVRYIALRWDVLGVCREDVEQARGRASRPSQAPVSHREPRIRRAGEVTTRARLVPGDLVISYGGGHVALYIGDGKVSHAPRPGRTVTVASLAAPSSVVGYRHITR
ncbi:hypothetical protein OG729_21840 [Streptomyces sp. NBC_00210]|uniref:NlpC/P60 family protein n=1 Tax=unclassified Streptomyces TaxID=2593676 RepID=UPI0032568417